ncbi:MAG: cation transporter [Chloroflexi bacterium]|nr:cation transporter [Chloroflexota bacterium]
MLSTRTRAAVVSVVSNSLLIILKVAVGLSMGSISVLSEAIHSSNDLLAALIAFLSLRVADRPPDVEHPYGHGKAENVSGTVEAALIIVAGLLILYGAIQKLYQGPSIQAIDWGIGVMAISAIVNILVSRYLLRVARQTDSVALEADAQHLTADVLTSVGVMLGLVAVRITGLHILDPIIALGVGAFIIRTGWKVLQRAFRDLVDTRLPAGEEEVIQRAIQEHLGEVVNFHDLRTRKAGRERHIDLHLVMSHDITIEEAHRLTDHLEEDIKSTLPHSSVTIHIEPCNQDCQICAARNARCPKSAG